MSAHAQLPRPAHVPSVYSETQLRQFLQRIKYPGFTHSTTGPLPEPTLATLALVQIHCLTTFAFESLALHYEPRRGQYEAMSLDPDYVFRRYVSAAEGGGYCFQSNYLLLQMLRALGFRVFPVLGRVFNPTLKASRPYIECFGGLTHMTLLVYLPCHLDRTHRRTMSYYLVDIGFGRGAHRPMLLAEGHSEEACAGVYYSLDKPALADHSTFVQPDDAEHMDDQASAISTANANLCWRLQRTEPHGTETCYIFNTTECFTADFAVSNIAASSSRDPSISPFSNMILVCKYFFLPDASTPAGSSENELYPYPPAQILQKTLAGTAFKDPAGKKTELHTEEQRIETLKREFGLLPLVSTPDAVHHIQGKPSAIPTTS